MLWLQAGSCGGCTMAAIEHGETGWFGELEAFDVDLAWHPSLSEETGEEALAILERIASGATRSTCCASRARSCAGRTARGCSIASAARGARRSIG